MTTRNSFWRILRTMVLGVGLSFIPSHGAFAGDLADQPDAYEIELLAANSTIPDNAADAIYTFPSRAQAVLRWEACSNGTGQFNVLTYPSQHEPKEGYALNALAQLAYDAPCFPRSSSKVGAA